MAELTDVDWARMTAAVGRLAARVDDDGKEDLTILLDIIERATSVETA